MNIKERLTLRRVVRERVADVDEQLEELRRVVIYEGSEENYDLALKNAGRLSEPLLWERHLWLQYEAYVRGLDAGIHVEEKYLKPREKFFGYPVLNELGKQWLLRELVKQDRERIEFVAKLVLPVLSLILSVIALVVSIHGKK